MSKEIESMPSVFPQWAQDLNTALGIFGFIITVAVMIQVWSIKRSFLSRARLPEILKDLERAGSALNNNLQGWPSRKNDARAQVKVAATLLSTALPLVDGATKASLKQILKKLNFAAKSFEDIRYNDPDAAWDIYSDVQSSIVHVTQAVRNLKWD